MLTDCNSCWEVKAEEEGKRQKIPVADLEKDRVVSTDKSITATTLPVHKTAAKIKLDSSVNKIKMDNAMTRIRMDVATVGDGDDNNSVSTVSGSGIDFFRKFVQRKASNCKDCEEQFRREVLIDRLVSDSIHTKAVLAKKKSTKSSSYSKSSTNTNTSSPSINGHMPSNSSVSSRGNMPSNTRTLSELSDNSHNSLNHSLIVSSLGMHEMEQKARGCASRCKTHRNNSICDDIQSVGTKSSLSRSSSISGSGLLFLRNYLKKKKSKSKTSSDKSDTNYNKEDPKHIAAFNIVPVPFPPPSDFYGPAYLPDGSQDSISEDSSSGRRHSLCSTVADLLNEDFDCDDSELKNLDWEEWDEPLPDEISYDDLVSVISESFYSEDLDLSELCDVDWEGRKTVVANDNQLMSPAPIEEDQDRCRTLTSHYSDYKSTTPPSGIDIPPPSSKLKYSSNSFHRSSTFLQDLEAELELPPISDEKEEAVRALSRTIKQYMRTGSNSSYSTDSSVDRRNSRLSNYHNEQRINCGEELERNSRMSVNSPALSDYIPELVATNTSSSCQSPLQPCRRPLSQLLIYDAPGDASPSLTKRPLSQIYYHGRSDVGSGMSRSRTPSPESKTLAAESGLASGFNIFGSPSNVQPKRIHNEGKAQESVTSRHEITPDSLQHDPQRIVFEHKLRNESTKAANRDSLLCPNTPPFCASPGLQPPSSSVLGHSPGLSGHSPGISGHGGHRLYLRHSSCASTDSGCHLLEEKLASVSPTPTAPSNNIEHVLNNNRNKLASFWEKSVSNSVMDVRQPWLPNKEHDDRHGFKPFRTAFGSENNLFVNDRLNQFQDMTRRAAAERSILGGTDRSLVGGPHHVTRSHRASTGSDCSEFLEKITLTPLQPRRRESFNEYFV